MLLISPDNLGLNRILPLFLFCDKYNIYCPRRILYVLATVPLHKTRCAHAPGAAEQGGSGSIPTKWNRGDQIGKLMPRALLEFSDGPLDPVLKQGEIGKVIWNETLLVLGLTPIDLNQSANCISNDSG